MSGEKCETVTFTWNYGLARYDKCVKKSLFFKKKKGQIAKSGINKFEIFSIRKATEIFSFSHCFLILGATTKSWLPDFKTFDSHFLMKDRIWSFLLFFTFFTISGDKFEFSS